MEKRKVVAKSSLTTPDYQKTLEIRSVYSFWPHVTKQRTAVAAGPF